MVPRIVPPFSFFFHPSISLFALLVHCTALLEYLPSSARYIPLTIVTPWFRDESAGQGIRMRDPSSIIEHRQLLIPSWPPGIAPGPRKRRGSLGIRSILMLERMVQEAGIRVRLFQSSEPFRANESIN